MDDRRMLIAEGLEDATECECSNCGEPLTPDNASDRYLGWCQLCVIDLLAL